jgi:hypothetical protein
MARMTTTLLRLSTKTTCLKSAQKSRIVKSGALVAVRHHDFGISVREDTRIPLDRRLMVKATPASRRVEILGTRVTECKSTGQNTPDACAESLQVTTRPCCSLKAFRLKDQNGVGVPMLHALLFVSAVVEGSDRGRATKS